MAEEVTVHQEIMDGLTKVIEDQKIKNYTIALTRGNAKGDNYIGIITRAKIVGENEKGEATTLNVVLKIAAETEEFRKYVHIELVYKRELLLYETLFPALLQFQKELKLERPFYPFAKCYGGSLTPPREYIIMEDMVARGFTMKDRKTETNLNHCLLVMRTFGKYHALALALKQKRPQVYQSLLDSTREIYFNSVNLENLCETIKSPCDKVIARLDETKDGELIEKIRKFVRFPVEGLSRNLSAEAAGDCAVFCQGDCWSNNFLFKYQGEDTSNPTDLCILDWQLSRCASPAVDVAYFLFVCTEKNMRNKHFDELLEAYHSSLREFLKEMDCDMDVFPKNVFLDHMKRLSGYGLMMTLIVVPLLAAESEEIPEWMGEMKADDRKKMFSGEKKNETAIVDRLVDVFRDFYRFGYFL